jgi:hypothetical protein
MNFYEIDRYMNISCEYSFHCIACETDIIIHEIVDTIQVLKQYDFRVVTVILYVSEILFL